MQIEAGEVVDAFLDGTDKQVTCPSAGVITGISGVESPGISGSLANVQILCTGNDTAGEAAGGPRYIVALACAVIVAASWQSGLLTAGPFLNLVSPRRSPTTAFATASPSTIGTRPTTVFTFNSATTFPGSSSTASFTTPCSSCPAAATG